MSALDRAIDKAKTRKSRVVFPEMHDERISEAANALKKLGICEPVGLAKPTNEHISAIMESRGLKESVARRMLARPLYHAAAMVAANEVDAMVAGANSPTRRVIEAASIVIGLAENVTVPSSFFLMLFPDGRETVFADCAVNVAPDSEGLAAIARASNASAAALLGESRVALLSFSTGTSGSGDSVETVRAAAKATSFTGPLQADAALNPSIAVIKGMGSGDANTLVFPDLNSGNIAYKLAQELAGAKAIGPILQGFRRPVCDLSRGASVEDIVAATAITLAMSPA